MRPNYYPDEAARLLGISHFQRVKWRGLAEDPDQRRPGLNVIFEEVTREHPSWTVTDRMAEAKTRWDMKHDQRFCPVA